MHHRCEGAVAALRIVACEHARVHLELCPDEATNVRNGARTGIELRDGIEESVRQSDMVDGIRRVDQEDTLNSDTLSQELARSLESDSSTKRPAYVNSC